MKKTLLRSLSLALCLALCLAVLPSFAAAATKISSVSVEIAPPEAGKKPGYTLMLPGDAPYYSADNNLGRHRNDVSWYSVTDDELLDPDSGRFEVGKDYLLTIFLTAKDGYAFDFDNLTATVNGRKPRNCYGIDGQLCLEYYYGPLPRKIGSVSVEIDPPKAGGKPSYTAVFPASAGYRSDGKSTGSFRNGISWYNLTDRVELDPEGGLFEAGKEYELEIRLAAKDGCAFDFKAMTATVNGMEADSVSELDGRLRLKYAFDRLPQARKISSVSVEIEPPQAGAQPSYELELPSGADYFSGDYSNSKFMNDIGWCRLTDYEYVNPESGVFKAGERYLACIYLTAKDGCVFDFDKLTATVNGGEPRSCYGVGDQLYLEYAFDTLHESGTITTVSVKIDPPKAGAEPDWTATLPTAASYRCEDNNDGFFRNGVCWENLTDEEMLYPGDVFEAGKNYRFMVYLEAKSNCSFSPYVLSYVNGKSAKTGNYAPMIYVTYDFELPVTKKISSVSVELDPPEAGKAPSYTASFPAGADYFSGDYSDARFRNDIAWYNETDDRFLDPTSDRFEAGKTYAAEIYLTAKDGCVFDFDKMTARVDGVEADRVREEKGQLYLYFRFDPLPAGKWGDVNGDGKADSDDAMLILRYDVKKIGAEKLKNFAMADVDGSGVVDSDDAMLILRYDVKKIAKFPVEK